MKIVEGMLAPQIDAGTIVTGWNERFAAQGAPLAELTTDGETFRLSVSSTWDIASLKQSFEIEVHRVNPKCEVSWV